MKGGISFVTTRPMSSSMKIILHQLREMHTAAPWVEEPSKSQVFGTVQMIQLRLIANQNPFLFHYGTSVSFRD